MSPSTNRSFSLPTRDPTTSGAKMRGAPQIFVGLGDAAKMADFGVASTPGIVVDGKVVHAGGLPKEASIADWLRA